VDVLTLVSVRPVCRQLHGDARFAYPREFLAAITFIRGLTGGCTHTGFRDPSLEAIAMDCSFAVSPVSFLQLSHL
jgi:hypothetical protein